MALTEVTQRCHVISQLYYNTCSLEGTETDSIFANQHSNNTINYTSIVLTIGGGGSRKRAPFLKFKRRRTYCQPRRELFYSTAHQSTSYRLFHHASCRQRCRLETSSRQQRFEFCYAAAESVQPPIQALVFGSANHKNSLPPLGRGIPVGHSQRQCRV